MKNKYISVLILTTLSLNSCSEGFFNLTPNYEVTVESVYKTDSDFNIALMGCYAKLQTQNSYYLELCEFRSDNLYLNAPTAGTQDRYDLDQFKDVATNGILGELWANFNNGVYRCNLILDRIDAADIDAKIKAQYKAEAMVIRAFTYFNMYRAWGCVPVTTKVVSVAEALKIGRCTKEEMYNLLSGDLEEVVNNSMLPASYKGDNSGRITLGAARALLAKVYLTFGKAQSAANVLSDMIGKYSLLPNIADVFKVDNSLNNEIIWAIRYNKTIVGEGHGAWYSITNLTDDNNQTMTLKSLYSPEDSRKSMIEYSKVPGVSVCLMKKFFDTPDAATKQYGNDFIVLRYSDVLLMYAEALNEVAYDGSSNSQAFAFLNEVRQRAGLAALSAVEIPDQVSFRKAILLERHKEFPYEGQRWFDAIRLGVATEAATAEGHEIQEYQFLFPIPNTELDRINDRKLLWQNPGY